MQRDVEQAAEASREHRRQRTDGCRIEYAIADHAQASRPFGDEHAAVGKERDSPGMIEVLRVQGHVHDGCGPRPRSHGPAPSVLTGAGPRPPAARALAWRRCCGRRRLLGRPGGPGDECDEENKGNGARCRTRDVNAFSTTQLHEMARREL